MRYEALKKDILSYVDMAECIKKNAAKIVYEGENGLFLYEEGSGIYMLALSKKEAAGRVFDRFSFEEIARKSGWLVAHGESAREAVYQHAKVLRETPCYQIAYLKKELLPISANLEFRTPSRTEIEIIKREYDKESPENIEKLCAKKCLYCGFLTKEENGFEKGEFVGFIGRHPEGSMGMLQVFPKYRRRGYAEALESFMTNEYLKEGLIPYGHVIEDNFASMALQKKLGFEVADNKVYWLKIVGDK